MEPPKTVDRSTGDVGDEEDRESRDRRLVRAVLGGNGDAFGELVAAYQRLVGSVAWRYGVSGSEIEDVVSEVFIKVYQKLHRFRPEHAFSTWLYRLAANHVVDHGRRTRRQGLRVEMPEQLDDPAQSAGAAIEQSERVQALHAAMNDVAPRYREALFLVYVEGMKVDQAARTLGLPQGTIKTRLMRGRQALRRLLTRRYPDYFGA